MKPNLELLECREMPTVALFSNGQLAILGDTNPAGNVINVAIVNNQVQVTDRGAAVPIISPGAAPTPANLASVVEVSGYGPGSVLMTDKSLGAVPTAFIANGLGSNYVLPGNNAPAVGIGAANANNEFVSNPGGKDTFYGGAGTANNLFFWPPGTGTDVYHGAGASNIVAILGNAGNQAETDSLTPDGRGGVVYSRNNLVPFQIYGSDIQNWLISPSGGPGNKVTVGDLTGTPTLNVLVNTPGGKSDVNASAQQNPAVVLSDYSGNGSTLETGAGLSFLVTGGNSSDTVTLTRATDQVFTQDQSVVYK